jgi:hypothetical protein
MKFIKPDGTIELATTGCCCPPGAPRRGLHTNCGTQWWRIVAEGEAGPWSKILRFSSTRTLAAAAESCAEFVEALKIDKGDAIALA